MAHHPIHCPGLLSELDLKKTYSTRDLAQIAKQKGYLGTAKDETHFARALKKRINKRGFPKGGHFVRYTPNIGLEACWLGSLWQTLLEKQSPLVSPVDGQTWFLFQQVRALLFCHPKSEGAYDWDSFFEQLPRNIPSYLHKETQVFLTESVNTHHHLWLIYIKRQQS